MLGFSGLGIFHLFKSDTYRDSYECSPPVDHSDTWDS